MRDLALNVARHIARSGKRLAALAAVNLLLTAVLFYLLERAYGASYSVLDSIYWTGITASSTGYGDILPTLASTKILALWVVYTTWAAFVIAGAMLAAWLVANPFEDEVLDDNDDQILLLGLICDHLGIEVPESVEEYHSKPTFYDTQE